MRNYPRLEEEIFKRGIKKKAIAKKLGIAERTLSNKLAGRSALTWPEASIIRDTFFPDMDKDDLFNTPVKTDTQQAG